jgi:hypothetical protein
VRWAGTVALYVILTTILAAKGRSVRSAYVIDWT